MPSSLGHTIHFGLGKGTGRKVKVRVSFKDPQFFSATPL